MGHQQGANRNVVTVDQSLDVRVAIFLRQLVLRLFVHQYDMQSSVLDPTAMREVVLGLWIRIERGHHFLDLRWRAGGSSHSFQCRTAVGERDVQYLRTCATWKTPSAKTFSPLSTTWCA